LIQASSTADGWFDQEWQDALSRRLGRAVAVSLAVHLGVLIVMLFVRLPHLGERPLVSMEVSLASLPTPPVKVTDPPKMQEKVVEVPKPAMPVKSVPVHTPVQPLAPAPPVPRMAAAPAPPPPAPKLSNDVMRDVMKGVELPPDAPRFGDYSPTEKSKKTHLKLPDVPLVSDSKEPVTKVPDVKTRPLPPSLSEDLTKELDEELKKIKKVDLPKSAPVEVPQKAAPQLEAKIPSVKAVDTTLKVPGMAPGSNAYLGLVRRKISNLWSAPPVADASANPYGVTIKFRIHRDGKVTGVTIEQSSGNEYYDLAGKRAVLSADPLPPFPADITESSYDAHFTFIVGTPQG